MSVDPFAEVVNQIKTSARVGKREIILKRNNRLIRNVLNVLKEEGYIQGFELIGDGYLQMLKVTLIPERIREFQVVNPRAPVKYLEIIQKEMQYLPSYVEGILILTTPKGVMSNRKAKELKIGGRIIAYIF
ncbi:MAG: 30S ribosomal protein S8 [Candidatus Anstonellales archaeon]